MSVVVLSVPYYKILLYQMQFIASSIFSYEIKHLRLNEADGGLRTDADLQLTFSDVGLKNLQATLRDFQASRNFYSPIFSHFSRTSLPAPLAQLGDVSLRGQLNVDFPIRSLESAVGKFMGDDKS